MTCRIGIQFGLNRVTSLLNLIFDYVQGDYSISIKFNVSVKIIRQVQLIIPCGSQLQITQAPRPHFNHNRRRVKSLYSKSISLSFSHYYCNTLNIFGVQIFICVYISVSKSSLCLHFGVKIFIVSTYWCQHYFVSTFLNAHTICSFPNVESIYSNTILSHSVSKISQNS